MQHLISKGKADMRHLLPFRYIEAISKAGSIRKAAELLAITPSALNRRLLSLEEELGVAIFERLATGVRLNTAGEILLAHIRTQFSDLERVKSQIADLSGERRGHIKLAFSPDISCQFLADQIQRYQTESPAVTFEVNQLVRGQAEQALTEHLADIALVFEPLKLRDFQVCISVPQPLYCIMDADHPLAKNETIRLYECVEYIHSLPTEASGLRLLLERAALNLGINLQCKIQSNNFGLLNMLELEQQGLRFDLPINASMNNQQEESLVSRILHPGDVKPGLLFIGHLKGRVLPVASARFLERIVSALVEKFGD